MNDMITIDDIEAFWLSHPEISAQANHLCDCLIGVPLQQQYGKWIEIRIHSEQELRIYTGRHAYDAEEPARVIPLPDELHQLALAFDHRYSPEFHEPEDESDRVFDPYLDDPCPTIPGKTCIAFITEYRLTKGV